MLKKNSPILMLIITVVGALIYSVYGGSNLFLRKPSMVDSKCYGVDVPSSVKYHKAELFCSCIHVGGHVSKEENYKYCLDRFTK